MSLCGQGDGTCKEPRSGDGIAIGAKAAGKSGRRGADRVSHDLSAIISVGKRSWVQTVSSKTKKRKSNDSFASLWSR